MNKEKLKKDYLFLFNKMLCCGILSLEDYLDNARIIPGFEYSIRALIDCNDVNVCLEMYKAFKDIENFDIYYPLAEHFFLESSKYFNMVMHGDNIPEGIKRIDYVMTEIESFTESILNK